MGTYSFVNDVMHDAVLYTDRGVMSLFLKLLIQNNARLG